MFRLFAAPLQGYTEAPFRHFHTEVYGCDDAVYMTPFVRMEKGEPRRRDMRDITSELNGNHTVIPQIIFRDAGEFASLTAAVAAAGYKYVNLNMGCPFPPQCHKGRGAAMTGNREVLEQVCDMMHSMPSMKFSVKMRPGLTDAEEWRTTADILRAMPLEYVIVHPRTASQQYTGELHIDQLQPIAELTEHALIYNGDIASWTDIVRIADEMPFVTGVMAGRGLLARPSLFNELAGQREWPREKRIEHMLHMHDLILEYYAAMLCGDTQILAKIKPLWDFAEGEIGHKAYKLIRKATSMSRYREAISRIS